jgi:glycosyltransferase involved in cell wall biosynthesis
MDSLADQTLADHEVIAVDDGSRDGTGARLEARARLDTRLRVLRTPPRGLVAALNTGLARARSPLLARMDADDVALSERLRLQAERLERDPTVDILGCRVRLGGPLGAAAPGGMGAYVDWLNGLLDHESMLRDRLVEAPVAHPSIAMRTETLRGLGGWRDFDGPEDYDLWLRAFEVGLRFAKLPETLLVWNDSPGRLTRTDPRYASDRFRALKIQSLGRGPLASGRPAVVWGSGPVGKGWARALVQAGHRVVAFAEVAPRKLGGRIHGLPVLTAEGAARCGNALHLGAVGQRGARERIRREATRLGLVEGRDFVAVA